MRDSLATPALQGLLLGTAAVMVVGLIAFRLICWPWDSTPQGKAVPLAGLFSAEEDRPAAPSAPDLQGVIELDPRLAGRVAAGSVVFVTLRREGSPEGPPLAAKRLPANRFPVAFTVHRDDSMLGTPLSERLVVDARLDGDGDAGTREPDEPQVHAEGVEPGSEVRLVLR